MADRCLSVKDMLSLLADEAGRDDLILAFDTVFSPEGLVSMGIDINGPELKRIDAAIMLHIYLRDVAGIPDLTDISGASVLKDLYDCRKCVNHIAQVYLRGLMRPVRYTLEEVDILLFDGQKVTGKTDVFLTDCATDVV